MAGHCGARVLSYPDWYYQVSCVPAVDLFRLRGAALFAVGVVPAGNCLADHRRLKIPPAKETGQVFDARRGSLVIANQQGFTDVLYLCMKLCPTFVFPASGGEPTQVSLLGALRTGRAGCLLLPHPSFCPPSFSSSFSSLLPPRPPPSFSSSSSPSSSSSSYSISFPSVILPPPPLGVKKAASCPTARAPSRPSPRRAGARRLGMPPEHPVQLKETPHQARASWGGPVVIFPEGARTNGSCVLAWKARSFDGVAVPDKPLDAALVALEILVFQDWCVHPAPHRGHSVPARLLALLPAVAHCEESVWLPAKDAAGATKEGKPPAEQIALLRTVLARMLPGAVEVQVGADKHPEFMAYWDASQRKRYTNQKKA
ncbi:unnamed protein product [Prorocentrum cordatum]|uniref:Phospholipid/glycerol acyltransferase domain-containing protein n=1 Tax=Prorocentrum cordatum TaxID=2364126 RepID=A0ABN9Q4B0_9DINO|nr:unnamed protein product [Polarella glacialis]